MNNDNVANRLMIIRAGSGLGKIKIPGCEPVTATTSDELMKEMREIDACCASMIDVEIALKVIPGSYVEIGAQPSERWFVFPSGPPPNLGECCHVGDWYGLLRNACVPEEEEEPECEAFELGEYCGNL